MAWSYRLATVRGIDLKVHITFAIIVVVTAANWMSLGWSGVAFGVALVLLLFGCVTLHEFGHALAAQRFGIPVRQIVLLPIGGVAILSHPTRHPLHELVIAAAGPAVNVAILSVLAPLLFVFEHPFRLVPALLHPDGMTPSFVEALRWLVSANVGLVLFNLIPAFPLDGGRILRGALAMVMGWTPATEWATLLGRAIAFGMGAWGVVSGQLTLVIIASVVFFSASATAAEERAHSVLASHRLTAVRNGRAIVLDENDRVSDVVPHLLSSFQSDFAVFRGSALLGVVSRAAIIDAVARQDLDTPLAALMTEVPVLAARGSLADARVVLAEAQARVVAIYDTSEFLGLVGLEEIAEAEQALTSLEAGRSSQRGSARRLGGEVFRRSSRPAPGAT